MEENITEYAKGEQKRLPTSVKIYNGFVLNSI